MLLFGELQLVLLHHSFHIFSVDHLVESRLDVATSQLLHFFTGLDQQIALVHSHVKFITFNRPCRKTGIATRAMNGQQVEILVETREYATDGVLNQIAPGGCQ